MLKSSCFQLRRSPVHFPSMSAKTVVLTFALCNSSKLTSHSPLFTLFPSHICIYILSLNHSSAKVSSSRPKSSDQCSQRESFCRLQPTRDHKVLNPRTSARSGGIPIWIEIGHQPLRPILIHKSTYPTDFLFSGSPPVC